VVTLMATGIGCLFFVLATAVAGVGLAESFIFAMGMIVAFVPEGMLPTVTLSLAMGVQRMARRNALVKRLSAVESLGCTTTICTDKTGTLTENEMTVRALWVAGRGLTVTGVGYGGDGDIRDGGEPVRGDAKGDLERLLVAGGLCNDARLVPPDGEAAHWSVLGDPTEAALKVVAPKGGVDLEGAAAQMPRVREFPFDSRRKRMTTIHRSGAGRVAFVKGAPREVLSLCAAVRRAGAVEPLEGELRDAIIAANDAFARAGLRVLAVAEREVPAELKELSAETVEGELTFLGLMAMMDPPRAEVAQAVTTCRRAGIRIIMITGDYGLTAESIARRIGIVGEGRPRLVSGADLDAMDDGELRTALDDEVIFARVAPEHKLRIVRALREAGHVVAVTGDGVNDAPALKHADIGVAMGRSGTDVAKEAADIILTDDNFASIVHAVEEGRAVYANIRKFAVYVFNSNMAEAVPFIVMLFSAGRIPLPLTVMQVLSIDLGTDMVPAIGLGSEPPEAGVMDRPPRSRSERLLNMPLLVRALLWYGLIESVAAMAAYFYLNWLHGWPAVPLAGEGTAIYRTATTMTLAGIVVCQAAAVLACRSGRTSLFSMGFFTNRLVLVGIAIEFALLGIMVYTPLMQRIFHTAPLGIREWLFLVGWAPLLILADEVRKAVLRRRDAKGAEGGTP
jgi:magnesium-transporting ATPase (P-type)